MSKGIIGAFSALAIALIGLFTVNVGSASAAMVFHSGFESGNTFEWSSTWGAVSIQTSIKNTGTYAMRCNPSTSPIYVDAGGTTNGGSFYLYIAASASIETIIFSRNSDSNIRLTGTDTTPNYITLYDGSTLRGTSTTQLASSTWYRISFARDASGNGAVYINGTQEISTTTLADDFSERVGIVSTGAATADLYFDDVAFDDAASIADIGDIHTLLSLPNAAGNYSQFDTPVGSSTHYENVDDAPGAISDTDYNQHAANSGTAYDTYNIQDASTLGIGANDTINAVCYFGRMRRGRGFGGTTHHLAVRDNGSDYTTQISATRSFTWYSRYDAVMPNDGAAWTQARFNAFEVGAYHGSGRQDTDISACMVMVAYTPAPNIANAPASKDFGVVNTNSSYWSNGSVPTFPLDDGECYFAVTNNSSDTVNISIRTTNFTGGVGWTLAASPGVNIVTLKAGRSGDATEGDMVILTTSDQGFITSLGASSSRKWEIKLETGTFTDTIQKTSTITLTATFS